MEFEHGSYSISDDPSRLDAVAVHAYLTTSYWAAGIPLETVTRSLAGSFCLGIYAADKSQVGLVRVITDYATFAYLCDVYVLEAHRGRGLAKAAIKATMEHPRLQDLRRFNLVTRDAHPLYAPVGFKAIAHPDRYMEKLDPDVYRRNAAK